MCLSSPGIWVRLLQEERGLLLNIFSFYFLLHKNFTWPTWRVLRWPISVWDNKTIPDDWRLLLGTVWPDSNPPTLLAKKDDHWRALAPTSFLFHLHYFSVSCKNSRLVQVPSYYGNKCYLNRWWIHVSQLQWVSGRSCGIWLHKCMGIMSVSGATEFFLSPWEDCAQTQKDWCNRHPRSGGWVSFALNGKCQNMVIWIFSIVTTTNASRKREWTKKTSKGLTSLKNVKSLLLVYGLDLPKQISSLFKYRYWFFLNMQLRLSDLILNKWALPSRILLNMSNMVGNLTAPHNHTCKTLVTQKMTFFKDVSNMCLQVHCADSTTLKSQDTYVVC